MSHDEPQEESPIRTAADLIAVLQRYPPSSTVIFHDEEIAIYEAGETLGKTLAQISESGVLEY